MTIREEVLNLLKAAQERQLLSAWRCLNYKNADETYIDRVTWREDHGHEFDLETVRIHLEVARLELQDILMPELLDEQRRLEQERLERVLKDRARVKLYEIMEGHKR